MAAGRHLGFDISHNVRAILPHHDDETARK